MGLSRSQLIAMILLVALPSCVIALTAIGLWQLDEILENVSEEYNEVRILQPIDRDLSTALLALRSGDAGLEATARENLESAEGALVRYLASQYESVATEQHQATESAHATRLLETLQALLTVEGQRRPAREQAELVASIREELKTLEQTSDTNVRATHDAANRARVRAMWRVITASVVSTSVCVWLLVWSTRSVNRRLRELHQRLTASTPGETAKTAPGLGGVVTQIEELNSRMIQKIEESGRELLRRERLAGIGLLAADVAHEINNPMNAMLGLSELGLRTLDAGPIDEASRAELQESLRVVRREALRCKAIIERLVAMVRSDSKPSRFDATRLIHETVQVARAARPDRAGCFAVTGAGLEVETYAPANDVRQILLTLLVNAADAVGPEGRIEVDATKTEDEVWLRVRDNGCGFTEAMRQTFFTPFKSYSQSGRGTGLGLSIAQALADGMGAELRPFSDGPGNGSMFILAIRVPEVER